MSETLIPVLNSNNENCKVTIIKKGNIENTAGAITFSHTLTEKFKCVVVCIGFARNTDYSASWGLSSNLTEVISSEVNPPYAQGWNIFAMGYIIEPPIGTVVSAYSNGWGSYAFIGIN